MISQKTLHNFISYNPETGHLSWIKPVKCLFNKMRTGRIDYNATGGYLHTSIFGRHYQVSKLVWLYHKGYYPEKILDHLNGISDDNRIENLREASSGQNARNQSLNKNNSSGIRGVNWFTSDGVWIARIGYNNKVYHLGQSKDLLTVVYLRYIAEKSLDWDSFKHHSTAYQYLKSINAIDNCEQIVKSLLSKEIKC